MQNNNNKISHFIQINVSITLPSSLKFLEVAQDNET